MAEDVVAYFQGKEVIDQDMQSGMVKPIQFNVKLKTFDILL